MSAADARNFATEAFAAAGRLAMMMARYRHLSVLTEEDEIVAEVGDAGELSFEMKELHSRMLAELGRVWNNLDCVINETTALAEKQEAPGATE